METPSLILFFHHGIGLGGAPKSLLGLIKSLDKKKFSHMVVCIYKGSAYDYFKENNINVLHSKTIGSFSHTTGSSYSLLSIKDIYKLLISPITAVFSILYSLRMIKKFRPKIIHLNSTSLIYTALIAYILKVPIIWHIREVVNSGYFGIRKYLIINLINKFATKSIFICKYSFEQFKKPENGSLIYNSVDFDKYSISLFDQDLKDKLKIQRGKNIILHLGGYRPIKGLSIFIDIFDQIILRNKNTILINAGIEINEDKSRLKSFIFKKLNIGYRNKIIKKIEKKNLSKYIINVPYMVDVENLISISDILIFTSTTPHFARPIMEAMAMGKCVIGSNIGGVNELIKNNHNGFLFNLKDKKDLVKIFEKLKRNEKVNKNIGMNAYNFAKNNFESKKNNRAIEKLFLSVLKNNA